MVADDPHFTLAQVRELIEAAVAGATKSVFEAKLHQQLPLPEVGPKPDVRCPGGFDEWQTWDGFRTFFLDQGKLIEGYPAKWKIAFAIGCSVRTIGRAQEFWGLEKRKWPPKTWPVKAPPKPGKNSTTLDFHPALVAAGLGGVAFMDLVSDGKLNDAMRFLHMCLPRLADVLM